MSYTTLSQTFIFEAAHTLDRNEASRTVHGHTYHAKITLRGPVNRETGMVVDQDDLLACIARVKKVLDHRNLDDVIDLGPSTLENLSQYIAKMALSFLCDTGLTKVRVWCVSVWRADGSEATFQSED
jgi:6-pyruvoyltetrahydropterin/6-carboxytetrahydropterin synthase